MKLKINIVTLLVFMFCLLTNSVYADSEPGMGSSAGSQAGNDIMSQVNTADKINNRLAQPLTSSETSMKTFGPAEQQQSFNAQLSAPSSESFLEVFAQPGSTGDLATVATKQDTDFDGIYDYAYNLSNVSGVCANGVISCNPGTWEGCSYYTWIATEGKVLLSSVPEIKQLAGCNCINNSCGSNLVWNNLDTVLKDLGGAIVGAIQDYNPHYTVTSVSIDDATITYYGQETPETVSACSDSVYFSGTKQPEQYYDPVSGSLPVDDEVLSQAADSDSYYTQLSDALINQNNPSSTTKCYEKRSIQFDGDGIPSVITTGTCQTLDTTGCDLSEENICGYDNADCVNTYHNKSPTGLTPLPYCKNLSSNDVDWEFCNDGTTISYTNSNAESGLLESGIAIWWNIHREYRCDEDDGFDVTDELENTKDIQASTEWLDGSQYSYDGNTGIIYGLSESGDTCEKACKVKAPVEDTQAGNEGTTGQYRKTVDSYVYKYKKCDGDTCPLESGETIVKNCSCLNEFAEATSIMQVLSTASKDLICSEN